VRYGRPFTAYLAAHGPHRRRTLRRGLWDAYLWHEHYTWNSARPRAGNATIEVRPACQQPPDESLAAAAFSLGLVEAMPRVEAFVRDRIGLDPWPAMAAYRRAVLLQGVRAHEPAPRLLAGLIDLAERALRGRGRGEELFLRSIRRRLETRTLPADRAVKLLQKGGVAGLIEGLGL
jgi:gamma-glutamylcysteine synthetase